jgi:hypothetical protein
VIFICFFVAVHAFNRFKPATAAFECLKMRCPGVLQPVFPLERMGPDEKKRPPLHKSTTEKVPSTEMHGQGMGTPITKWAGMGQAIIP